MRVADHSVGQRTKLVKNEEWWIKLPRISRVYRAKVFTSSAHTCVLMLVIPAGTRYDPDDCIPSVVKRRYKISDIDFIEPVRITEIPPKYKIYDLWQAQIKLRGI